MEGDVSRETECVRIGWRAVPLECQASPVPVADSIMDVSPVVARRRVFECSSESGISIRRELCCGGVRRRQSPPVSADILRQPRDVSRETSGLQGPQRWPSCLRNIWSEVHL
jgi:hypothetical protein